MPTHIYDPNDDADDFTDSDLLEPTDDEVDRALEQELDGLPDDDHMQTEKSVSAIHLNEEEVRLKKLAMALEWVRDHGADVNIFTKEDFRRSDPDRKNFPESLIKDREVALSAAYNFIAKEFHAGVPSSLFDGYNSKDDN